MAGCVAEFGEGDHGGSFGGAAAEEELGFVEGDFALHVVGCWGGGGGAGMKTDV